MLSVSLSSCRSPSSPSLHPFHSSFWDAVIFKSGPLYTAAKREIATSRLKWSSAHVRPDNRPGCPLPGSVTIARNVEYHGYPGLTDQYLSPVTGSTWLYSYFSFFYLVNAFFIFVFIDKMLYVLSRIRSIKRKRRNGGREGERERDRLGTLKIVSQIP